MIRMIILPASPEGTLRLHLPPYLGHTPTILSLPLLLPPSLLLLLPLLLLLLLLLLPPLFLSSLSLFSLVRLKIDLCCTHQRLIPPTVPRKQTRESVGVAKPPVGKSKEKKRDALSFTSLTDPRA